MPPKTTETAPAKDAPTEAQRAQLAALTEELGVEPPEITSAAEAQSAIEALQASKQEPEPEPEPVDGDPESEDEGAEQQESEEAQARSGVERSAKQTQAMFDRAVRGFHERLCVVFEVDEMQAASTPGVIGFLLPGYTEQKTHEDFARCQTCNGYGSVLTGSTKAGEETRACPDPRCKGRGYWERPQAQPTPQPQPVSPITGPTVIQTPAPNGGSEWAEAPAWMGDPRLATGTP